MPPIMMSLSCVALRSMNLITVFESPSMLATSSIFLWVPCEEPEPQKKKGIKRHFLWLLVLRVPTHSGHGQFLMVEVQGYGW